MWEDIRLKEAAMAKRYVKTQRHTIQVDYINFMDELAELNGCKPDVGQYQQKHLWHTLNQKISFFLSYELSTFC